ncbi:MAG: hypothetical protein Kow00121_05480 [Elainellaceae cyanobacterium]
MTSTPDDRLYKLLPAIYRIRDVAEGDSLRALLAIIEQELRLLETDIGNLYDNWFIETCSEWIVPYIGDLLDVRELDAGNRSVNANSAQSYGRQERRAYIANTLAYRRRKGTAPVLEQLARDVSGWRSRTVEFSRLILTTQNLNHLRLVSATFDLRADNTGQIVGTPFEQQASYTAEVRSPAQGGRYNAPNLGLYIWRLQSYPVDRSTARAITNVPETLAGRCYSFSPLGNATMPLFNKPQTETDITTLAQEINTPGMLRRVILAQELKQRRQLRLQGQRLEGIRYFDSDPVLQIFVNGQPAPIPPEEILICRLQTESDPQDESNPLQWRSLEELSWDLEDVPLPTKVVAVDPELGRITFLDQSVPQRVEVSYLYGFSDDLGGGSYMRNDAGLDLLDLPYTLIRSRDNAASSEPAQYRMSARVWEVEQTTSADANPLETAIQRWNQTVLAWEGLRQQTCIPLARITTSGEQISQPTPIRLREALGRLVIAPERQEKLYTRFKPGILGSGLRVIVNSGCQQVIVTSGKVIDRQGRRITILNQQPIALEEWGITAATTETRVLVVFYRSLWQRQQDADQTPALSQPSLHLISPTALDEYEPGTFIPLVQLEIQNGQVLTKTNEYPQFQPGIVQGFAVRIPIGTLTAIIQPGLAVDEQGRKIRTIENTSFDLSSYQEQNGFLVLTLQPELGGPQYQFEFVKDADFNDNLDKIYIPLAYLSVPKVELAIERPARWLSGFEVKPIPGELAVTMTPGKATIVTSVKSNQGTTEQEISIERAPEPVSLDSYQEQRVLIALTTGVNHPKRGEIAVLALDAIIQFTDYLPLVEVEVPKVSSNESANTVQVYPVRRVLQGLGVSISDIQPIITVLPGQAIDASGQEITLEQQHQFNLSSYPGRSFVVFISNQAGQGFPISAIDTAKPQDWRQLGIIPQEPNPSQIGIIRIKDAATYCGDLSMLLPRGRCLKLIAANGYQPLVRGNFWIRGTATAADFQQGELVLDGLLVEGQVSVLPGNLEQLQIRHCTLVPGSGGLRLRSSHPSSESSDADEGLTLIAMVIYCLSYVWQMISRELGWLDATTPKAPAQMVQFSLNQLSRLLTEMWQTIQQWLGGEGNDGNNSCWQLPSTSGQENTRLKISLYRSIAGLLSITDKVPILQIEDCLIDPGQSENKQTSGIAIAAPGTDADIRTTTVLGMTAVRSLEASNSLFTAKVIAFRHQTGCLRFTYVPEGSQTPRRYQCQPDMAFKRELDSLPEAITAIQVNAAIPYRVKDPDTNTLIDRPVTIAFAGTAGNGLFRSIYQSKACLEQGKTWTEINKNLADRHISAVTLYSRPGIGSLSTTGTVVTGNHASTRFSQELQPGDILTIANQSRLITEISNDRRLKVDAPFSPISGVPFQIQTLVAGSSSGQLFRSQSLGETWNTVPFDQSNAMITALFLWRRLATGTIEVQGTEVLGTETRFTTELRVGDTVTIDVPKNDQMIAQTRVVVAIGKPGTGTISSQGIRVTGTIEDFSTELKLGDRITALNSTNVALNQTRTITRLNLDGQSPNLLEVNAPFTGDLAKGTRFEINRDTILQLNASLVQESEQLIANAKMQIHQLIAATAGGGIFRATNRAENWERLNSGITNLNATALATHPETEQLMVGTGGGVFLLEPEDSQNQADDRWQPVNTGLKNRYVTALTTNAQQQLFAATAGGGIFRFVANSDSWIAVNQGLTSLDITALTVYRQPDSSDSGVETLLAGTSDGKLFQSTDGGESWQPTCLDLQSIDVTALGADPQAKPSEAIAFVGTAAGDLLYSASSDQTWRSVNRSVTAGLPNAATKLQIIDRLQPRFTSTRYGDPGYGQLSQSCALELRQGAEDGAEMGTFNSLKQAQRETNLEASLEENLRFGLNVGIFYVT